MTTVIIGAGVTGLSVALRLLDSGIVPVIISRVFPTPFETVDSLGEINYASQWAGAHNAYHEPPTTPSTARDHAFAVRTYHFMDATAKAYPEAGITFMKGLEYHEEGVPGYESLTVETAAELGYEDFRLLARDELPAGVLAGFEYRTWSLNPMVYCSFLLRRLALGGCRFVKRDLRSAEEVFSMKDLGQTCVVANPAPLTYTRQYADGRWSFIIPRNFHGGTIIGGTKEPNDWSDTPSLATRERILRDAAETYPEMLGKDGKFHVLRDIVGRRPTRKGGMRLEREVIEGAGTVIHAYGLGGRGYEMSWGVAEAVFELMGKGGPRL
ncbi:related to FAD dependent oxidoreductase superfamily [Cephalotrichum gorgonifer]|uniref:Related to FAD dependent oxidoreductase superfamily n=1 Tax=Cephalotrichum gorgonifer TaxID=2041049 RepID=A0AAE8MZY6_9PEZI|nr:related to FAD dependent oxidoreductase superfamily [Cephalotrichum gorgonifer]